MADLEKTMFREYDIRGRTDGKELTPDTVEIIAKAYGTMLRNREISKAVIGHDFRKESEWITTVAIEGLRATGIDVISLGMILTPMMYSAQYYYKAKGGVMITASHNPSGWSGFKLALGYSYTLGPEEIKELQQLTISEEFAFGNGTVQTETDFDKHYEDDLLNRINFGRKITVVINTGNGTPGPIAPAILRKAGCAVIKLYSQLDWDFPIYFPNPAREDMMEETGRKVVEIGADIGLAFDGDGDRLGITDEKGNTIWPDRYLILLARQVLEKHPGAKIIYDVKCTQALHDDIKAHRGIPIEWTTGHSYIKKKVFEEKAPLGGEMSGHIFISKPEYYGFDDAVFTALKLIEYLSHQEKTMSEIIAETPSYISSPTLNVSCADEVKYRIVDELEKDFKKGEEKEGYEISTINGVKVKFKDGGWGLVRASSNLPVLVLRFEAKTPERLEEIEDIFKKEFSKHPEIGNEWETG